MKENQASSTALLIAASLSFLDRHHQQLIFPEARQLGDWLLQNYSNLTRRVFGCLDQAWFRAVVHGLEAFTIPHMQEHYAERKRAIESLARETKGMRQLIVLGAGFDVLSLRLTAMFPNLRAVEVDHPATQAWKIKAVADCRFDHPNLAFIPQDLSIPQPLTIDLLGPGYRKNEQTLWIAEGFLMYFSAERVREFFQFIRQVSPAGSRVIFTYMEPQENGRVDFRSQSRGVRLWLAQRREPFAWGIPRRAVPLFLASLGFKALDLPATITREVDRLNVGEYLAVAEVK